MVHYCEEANSAVERLNSDFTADCEQVSAQATVPSDLLTARNASLWFGARWRSAREHDKANERHFTQAVQQLTVAQAKLAHENLW